MTNHVDTHGKKIQQIMDLMGIKQAAVPAILQEAIV